MMLDGRTAATSEDIMARSSNHQVVHTMSKSINLLSAALSHEHTVLYIIAPSLLAHKK